MKGKTTNEIKTPYMEKTDNELIAEFMGLRVHTSAGVLWYCDDDGWIDWVDGAEPYSPDRSWSDLMPVVEKIGSIDDLDLNIYLYSDTRGCTIFGLSECPPYINIGRDDKDTPTLLHKTYKAVVEFIKWYRSQPEGNTVNK